MDNLEYNIEDINLVQEKKKQLKKLIYCNNCGKYTDHPFKKCKQPVTSFGIININLENLSDEIFFNLLKKLNTKTKTDNFINIDENKDIEKFSKYYNNVKILLVRRKNSLGFMEFVRGHYKVDNIEGIIFLFKQMVKEEIEMIKTKDFDYLWDYTWGNKTQIIRENEYHISKKKFEILKKGDKDILKIDFYAENVRPKWENPEWGFPKGRRNLFETNFDCAVREFEEETSIKKDSYHLIKNLIPIEENFIGTNGVEYRHVYYLSISNNLKDVDINKENLIQCQEIGDIGYFSFYETIDKVRPYHTNRLKIISEVFMLIMNNLINILKLN